MKESDAMSRSPSTEAYPAAGEQAKGQIRFGSDPHGGRLKPLLATGAQAENLRDRASSLPSLTLSAREIADVECLASGIFSPLDGFMMQDDYRSVVDGMRLSSGLPWSLPVTASATDDEAASFRGRDEVALKAPSGQVLAVLHVGEIFRRDKEFEATYVFRTTDAAHPGVAAMNDQGEWLLGGDLSVIDLPEGRQFLEHRLQPEQTRRAIAEREWRTVVGFQTRNPIHRAHEYLTKCALEMVDGLLIHPLVGETKGDDIPAGLRMKAYKVLLDDYYPENRVLFSVFPAAMRYAGPREAIFHALCRKNYGCTHFIVGRDHAGVGSYYGTFEAHDIFSEFAPGELGITPLFFDHAFWCERCSQMATAKTCPHGAEDHVALSGTEVRRMLTEGEEIPRTFSRPEVADVLREGSGD